MRLKRPVKTKEESIRIRTKEKDKNRMQAKANIYTEGNLSEYIIYAALNFVPSKEDFEKR